MFHDLQLSDKHVMYVKTPGRDQMTGMLRYCLRELF